MIGCVSNSGHQKDMCIKVIVLHAQNTMIIQGSLVDLIGGTYVTTQ